MICACVDFRGIFLLLVVLRDSWIGGLVASLILENSQPLLPQIFFSSVFSFCLWYSNYTWLDLLNSSHKFLCSVLFLLSFFFPFHVSLGHFCCHIFNSLILFSAVFRLLKSLQRHYLFPFQFQSLVWKKIKNNSQITWANISGVTSPHP